jgi:hypothetical protein
MTKKVIETTNGWYMENKKEKVELEDIISLVQTDEPTNSVQLKKEAQLSICEKRIIELRKENEQLKADNNRLVNETAKVVAEHQKRVLDLIDNKIEELKNIDNMPLIPRESIVVLYDLRKELSE